MKDWQIDAYIISGLDEDCPWYEDEIEEEDIDYLLDLEFDNYREDC